MHSMASIIMRCESLSAQSRERITARRFSMVARPMREINMINMITSTRQVIASLDSLDQDQNGTFDTDGVVVA